MKCAHSGVITPQKSEVKGKGTRPPQGQPRRIGLSQQWTLQPRDRKDVEEAVSDALAGVTQEFYRCSSCGRLIVFWDADAAGEFWIREEKASPGRHA